MCTERCEAGSTPGPCLDEIAAENLKMSDDIPLKNSRGKTYKLSLTWVCQDHVGAEEGVWQVPCLDEVSAQFVLGFQLKLNRKFASHLGAPGPCRRRGRCGAGSAPAPCPAAHVGTGGAAAPRSCRRLRRPAGGVKGSDLIVGGWVRQRLWLCFFCGAVWARGEKYRYTALLQPARHSDKYCKCKENM